MSSTWARGRRYLAALIEQASNHHADPRLQVDMAVEEMRRRHQLLTEQAAAVLGNQRELEIKVSRALAEVERLRGSAGRALLMADDARRGGDGNRAQQMEETASLFAVQLAAAEM